MTPTTQTHPDVHPGTPSVPPNPPTVPGSVPPSRACPGEARRSRTEPRGRDGQRPGRGAPQETTATHDGHPAQARLHGMIDDLADALAAGVSDPRIESFLAWLSKLHRYSTRNALLISLQWADRQRRDPDLPDLGHVASYRTWQRLGRNVRRGERGMAILVPVTVRARPEGASDTPSSRHTREPAGSRPSLACEAAGEGWPEAGERGTQDGPRHLRFRLGHVFDVSQTEGAEIPTWYTDTPALADCLPALLEFATARGVTVRRGDTGTALGYSLPGEIVVSADLPDGAAVQTLLHELAHEILHQHGPELNLPAHVQESEAEAVAATVSGSLGENTLRSAAHYIRHSGGSPAVIRASLFRITQAASTILGALLPDPTADLATADPDTRAA